MSSISSTLRPVRNGRRDDQRPLREGGAAPPDQTRLGRLDFHDDESDAIRGGEDGLDVADLHRASAPDRLRVGGVGLGRERFRKGVPGGEQRGAAAKSNRTK
jgi:hypothetical protein